jgi:hypothetical protein
MGANIELWRYQLFSNQSLYLEEVFHNTTSNTPVTLNQTAKNPVMVAAGKRLLLHEISDNTP